MHPRRTKTALGSNEAAAAAQGVPSAMLLLCCCSSDARHHTHCCSGTHHAGSISSFRLALQFGITTAEQHISSLSLAEYIGITFDFMGVPPTLMNQVAGVGLTCCLAMTSAFERTAGFFIVGP